MWPCVVAQLYNRTPLQERNRVSSPAVEVSPPSPASPSSPAPMQSPLPQGSQQRAGSASLNVVASRGQHLLSYAHANGARSPRRGRDSFPVDRPPGTALLQVPIAWLPLKTTMLTSKGFAEQALPLTDLGIAGPTLTGELTPVAHVQESILQHTHKL